MNVTSYLLLGAGLIVAAGLWLGLLFVIDAVMNAQRRGTLIQVRKEAGDS